MNKREAEQQVIVLMGELKKLIEIIEKPDEPIKPTKEQRFWGLMQGLTVKTDTEKYPGILFLFKEEKCLVQYNSKDGSLWLHYSDIWSVFENEYSLHYTDIQSFIKIAVEKHLNCKGIRPRSYYRAEVA